MEKLKGVRVYWNGSSLVASDSMKPLRLPNDIKQQLPTVAFEGQLQCSNMEILYEAAHQGTLDKLRDIQITAFDAPLEQMLPYEGRLYYLQQNIASKIVKVIPTVKCASRQHFQEFYESIRGKGGLGVVLRNPVASFLENESFVVRESVPEECVLVLERAGGYNCMLPNGSTKQLSSSIALAPNDLVLLRSSSVVRKISNPTEEADKFYHYYVGKGKSALTRCRGCLQHIDPNQLRIKTLLNRIYKTTRKRDSIGYSRATL
jgi:hypothetical protein